MILTLRVDERLVHGQVVTSWTKNLSVTHIVVANNQAAEDKIQSMTLKMAVPSGIKSIIATIEDAAETLNDPRAEALKIFVVCNCPQDALSLVKLVPSIQDVNIANYGIVIKPEVKDKTAFTKRVFCDEDDLQCVRELGGMVEELYSQTLPTSAKKSLKQI